MQLSLEIARDQFKKDATTSLVEFSNTPLAEQFDKQAKEADELLLWIAGAENVIIEERRD